jgi:5-bromo-4-chloroindolyl phosphate hydrolysis protein
MGMSRETSTLIAGLIGAAILPILALSVGLPLWLSTVIVFGASVGLWYLLRAGAPDNADDETLLQTRNDTTRGLVADATAALDRLKRVAPVIQDQTMRGDVLSLIKTTDGVLGDVKDNPDRAMAVRRLFTFYLPNAVSVAEGWQRLERAANPAPARVQQTRDIMKALNDAFVQYAQQADAPDMADLDTTLKVLNASLKSDLEKAT